MLNDHESSNQIRVRENKRRETSEDSIMANQKRQRFLSTRLTVPRLHGGLTLELFGFFFMILMSIMVLPIF
jgi:hypothetical protein